MAYVGGEWLDRPARQERIDLIAARAGKLRLLYERGLASEYHIEQLKTDVAELRRLTRIHRAEVDMLYFMIEYASEHGNPGNDSNLIPDGVTMETSADFHRELCGLLDDISSGRINTHVAWACPRGHAKTAYLSNGYVLHQVVFRHRKYIIVISETTDVAGDFITWARFQIKYNAKLRDDFGELLDVRAAKNEADNRYEFITSTGTKVEAKGIGTQMRGLRNGAHRPDLFLLDDLESRDSTNTPELIEKSKTWFKEEAFPAMGKSGICIYLGTILCYGSLLDYVLRERKDFRSRKFAAIESWAERQDLWREWRAIYRTDSEDSPARARAFYDAHEADMLRGVKILWPEYFSYYEFMTKLEAIGTKSFNQEYQNEPTDEERQIFKPELFTYWKPGELDGMNLAFYGAIDFAMGKEKGDYSVIVTIAENVDTGILYVYDVWMARVHPDILLQEAVKLSLQHQYEVLAVEAQQAQEWFADKLSEALVAAGFPAKTRLKYIKQRTRKALRIEALLPDVQAARLRFPEGFREEMDQFYMYPMHPHDDFPDTVSMAKSAATGAKVSVSTSRRRYR